jgi:hypothetical protein
MSRRRHLADESDHEGEDDDSVWDDGDIDDDGEEPTIDCPHCGAEILELLPQCPHCGMYVSSEAPGRRSGWLTVTAALLLLAIVFGLLLRRG